MMPRSDEPVSGFQTGAPDAPSPSPTDVLRTAGTLVLAVRTLDQRLRETDQPEPLSIATLSILRQIDRDHDLPSVLARRLRLDPGRVTRLIDRLVAAGYVERTADTMDRRLSRLSLTESGRARVEAGRAELAEAMEDFLAGLTPEERRGLETGLAALRRVLESRES